MPMIYKRIAKIIVNHIKDTLSGGIYVNQYKFIPQRKIIDNISNAYIIPNTPSNHTSSRLEVLVGPEADIEFTLCLIMKNPA